MRLALIALSLLAVIPAHAALAPADSAAVRELLRARKFAEAETAALRLVANHPADAQAHALLGRVRIAQDDGVAAVQAFEHARDLAPQDSEIHRGLGDAYETALDRAGMLTKFSLAKKCLAAYERAVALDPSNLTARQRVLGFHVGAPALYGGKKSEAWKQAAAIKQLDPLHGHLAVGLLHGVEKKFPEALAEFEQALRLDPANYLAHYQVGRIAALTGEKLDRGVAAMQQALALPPTDDAPGHDAGHWRLGTLLEQMGDRAGAKSAYEASLRLNPHYEPAAKALAKLN